jgi:hypothetical protein
MHPASVSTWERPFSSDASADVAVVVKNPADPRNPAGRVAENMHSNRGRKRPPDAPSV